MREPEAEETSEKCRQRQVLHKEAFSARGGNSGGHRGERLRGGHKEFYKAKSYENLYYEIFACKISTYTIKLLLKLL